MKIALIREKYTDFGGAERYVASLAENLAQRGHEIEIFARTWKTRNQDGDAGVSPSRPILHRVPVLKGPSFLQILSFAQSVRKMLQKGRYDIIHSFERTLYQDIYRAGDGCHKEWLAQRRKIDPPGKAILHRVNPLHRTLLWIEKQIFSEKGCRAVMTNSRRGKKEIIDLYGVPEEKISVIYTPVDSKRFRCDRGPEKREELLRQFGLKGETSLLLFVGSGFKRKGLTATLKALALLPSPVHLLVVGKDRLAPYKRLAGNLGIEKAVTFTGPLTDVVPYYQGADLFVFPTIYEPFSNVCIEAMAAGLPVVTSRINGASEVLLDGENGCIIEDPLDPAEIAAKIRLGLAIPKNKIAESNHHVLDRLTWGNHIEQVLALYRNVLNEKGLSGKGTRND
ncbi:UDP-glucose:(heptosyl)LPS alpha-1,3-glucosyltransferase [Syntrophus gentianae]|uniref:UDP-glucose:(Heptosyl)LPS alpha-1,3-glucosyltransferase n=1 Tax=Syntrophus gentianae TaxID=43775 RepID=A0A1H7UEU3_9BACT|nr:glycosyltransferase family 4 protein [Syntrophus gentianae]SEL94747.1 UDP-glucose:(heptosyl)LPS alpha-1,3-glucosyltransferase [Syntrophus gentianae]